MIGTLTVLGGGAEVGASCYLYELLGTRLLIDAGRRPGVAGAEGLPWLETLRRFPPDHLLLSHAHHDHVGALPDVLRLHPRLKIRCTEPTAQLAKLVLEDSLRLAGGEGEADVNRAVAALSGDLIPGEAVRLGDVEVTPQLAGHLLGAVSFTLRTSAGTVLHLGDFNHQHTPTTRGARLPDSRQPPRRGEQTTTMADVVVTESTYGDRDVPTRETMGLQLARQVDQTVRRGGHVLIPSFALGRAQDVVHTLEQMMARGVCVPTPIRLDGMAREATRIHERCQAWLPEETRRQAFGTWNPTEQGYAQSGPHRAWQEDGGQHLARQLGRVRRETMRPREQGRPERGTQRANRTAHHRRGAAHGHARLGAICGPHVQIVGHRERQTFLRSITPGVTIASSGMLSGGPSLELARHLLPDTRHLMLLVGYQDAESPGRAALAAAGGHLTLGRERIQVRAQVQQLSMSAHADQSAIIRMCLAATSRVRAQGRRPDIILIHGDPAVQQALAGALSAADLRVRYVENARPMLLKRAAETGT